MQYTGLSTCARANSTKSWMDIERYWWEVTLISGSINLPFVNDSKIIGNYRSKPTTSVKDSEIIDHPAMISYAWPWNGREIWLLFKQKWSYSFIGEGFIIYVLLMLWYWLLILTKTGLHLEYKISGVSFQGSFDRTEAEFWRTTLWKTISLQGGHTTHHFLFKWVRPRSVRWVENHGSQVLLVREKFKGTVSSAVVTHQPHPPPPKDPRSSGGGICRVVKRMIRGVSSLSFSKISVSESKVYWPMIH